MRFTKYINIPNIIKIIVVFVAYESFLYRLWVGEDAFIFFRYVDNFIHGNGLVFNVGERVEGFTSPLWVFVLALIKNITNAEMRPLSIVLGLFLSCSSIALITFWDTHKKVVFPLGVLLLITNSAFRDFATSGFETSLTYILVTVFGIMFKKGYLTLHPFKLGLVLSLLVLNRPESFLLLIYVSVLSLIALVKEKPIKIQQQPHSSKKKKITSIATTVSKDTFSKSRLLTFFISPAVILGGYELFRMGYYAAILPNTYYAKKGGSLYISQGFHYIKDFVLSYPLTCVVLLSLFVAVLVNLKYKFVFDGYKKTRLHLLAMSGLLLFYVLYAGGDYMHGRSLLMFFLLFTLSINDFAELLAQYGFEKIKNKETEQDMLVMLCAFIFIIAFFIFKSQTPLTVKYLKPINNIDDERHRFGNAVDMKYLKEHINIPITGELGWRDRGFYYQEITLATKLSISVVNPNIGFFGYAAGPHVSIYGVNLIDPYLARLPIEKRGKIGHEGTMDWPYLLSLKPTFSYTPYKLWNDAAHAKLELANHVDVITDDSNDSFVPVFDISDNEFIRRYTIVTSVDVKKNIDTAQETFLLELNPDNYLQQGFDVADYFSFLKVHWYPYTTQLNQQLYLSKRQEIFGDSYLEGKWEIFERDNKASTQEMWRNTTQSLTFKTFGKNIMYALTK